MSSKGNKHLKTVHISSQGMTLSTGSLSRQDHLQDSIHRSPKRVTACQSTFIALKTQTMSFEPEYGEYIQMKFEAMSATKEWKINRATRCQY